MIEAITGGKCFQNDNHVGYSMTGHHRAFLMRTNLPHLFQLLQAKQKIYAQLDGSENQLYIA